MADKEQLKKFLEEVEGRSTTPYTDHKGNPTVGVGSNLNSPEMPAILNELGVTPEQLQKGLPIDTQDAIMDKQLDEKGRYLQNIQKRDFPNANLAPHQETAVKSLMYNAPGLVGPDMRGHLDKGDTAAAVKEILLRSNKNKIPGIQRRRLKEAETFAGDEWQQITDSLTDEERGQIYQLLEKIQNPHTKEQTLKEYDFLKPKKRFEGLE